MTKTKSTKRALLMSALAILACVSMLVGSTFAWFTDTATTGTNTIQAGTLQVCLHDSDDNSLEGTTLSFMQMTADGTAEVVENPLWEPGATFITQQFKVVNEGDLNLKYNIVISGINGDVKLNEVMEWSVIDGNGDEVTTMTGNLAPRAETPLMYLKGHMKETATNEYQGLSISGIGITVVATQAPVEYDSEDNQYDADVTVDDEDELNAALADDHDVIVLGTDIELTNSIDIPAGKTVTLNLNGKTLSYTTDVAAASCAINNKGTLTLKSGTVTYKGVGSPNYGYGTNTINNTGKLVIDGATIINTTTSGSSVAIDCYAGAELIVNSGVIKSVRNAIRLCPMGSGAINCTINGGDITGARAIEIQLPSNNSAQAPEINLTVNGGILNVLDTVNEYAVYSVTAGQSFDNVNVDITGGTFNGYVGFGLGSAANDAEHVNITGGTFNYGVWKVVDGDWEEIPTT